MLCSGDSRTGESISGLPFCGCDRLDSEVHFTATGVHVRSTVLVRMIDRRSRIGACRVLAFIVQVRLQYNSLLGD